MILFRLMFRLSVTVALLCAAAVMGWLGILAGYGSFLGVAVILVFLAYENAIRAFYGPTE